MEAGLDLAPHGAGLGEVSMGTTIMAMKYDGGVILAADAKTSSGAVVVNRFARKITQIAPRVWMLRSGSAADTQFVAQILKHYLQQHTIELATCGQDMKELTVKAAASLCRKIMYLNDGLSAGLIIAGVDDVKGPQVYQISDGVVLEQKFAMGGSGSLFIAGLADTLYKPELNKAQATDACKTLLVHAMNRDPSSGGMIRYVTIDQRDGTYEGAVCGSDIPRMEDYLHSL